MTERTPVARLISYTLVAVQFICLLYLAATAELFASGWWLGIFVLGGVLGLWAIGAMGVTRVRVTPDVRTDAELVERGPYRWIRHPMYTAVLLVGLALVLTAPLLHRWLVFAVLIIDLLIKLQYEESLLQAALSDYPAYRQRTWRLLPYIY